MKDRQWRKFLRDIQEGRCILMLGSRLGGVMDREEWKPLAMAFSKYLAAELKAEGISYEAGQEENLPYIAQLFLTIEDVRRIDLEDEAKDFIKSKTKEIPPIYHALTKLPFSLVINTSLDDYLERAFSQAGKFSNSYFYNFKRKSLKNIDPEMISTKTPLIYNLLGSLEKTESLVLTDEDQLEFVHNVVREDPGVPEQILEQFDHSKTYLFLGFNLEHWQFRLLLESLNLKEGNSTHMPSKSNQFSSTTKNIFRTRFKFHFIEEEIDSFIGELNTRFEEFTKGEKFVKTRPPKKVFIAYDNEDKAILDKIENFAAPLVDRKELELVHKEKIPFGQEEAEAVRAHMETADSILLLLSADFLANPTIKTREMTWAFELNAKKNTQIIPIIGRTCAWEMDAQLTKLVPLPAEGTPIIHGSWAAPDDAYFTFVQQLEKRIW